MKTTDFQSVALPVELPGRKAHVARLTSTAQAKEISNLARAVHAGRLKLTQALSLAGAR